MYKNYISYCITALCCIFFVQTYFMFAMEEDGTDQTNSEVKSPDKRRTEGGTNSAFNSMCSSYILATVEEEQNKKKKRKEDSTSQSMSPLTLSRFMCEIHKSDGSDLSQFTKYKRPNNTNNQNPDCTSNNDDFVVIASYDKNKTASDQENATVLALEHIYLSASDEEQNSEGSGDDADESDCRADDQEEDKKNGAQVTSGWCVVS